MALNINTNITSMNAQRNLNKTQSTLNKSMMRLTTGLRINSAKDDAAGLAISNRMDSQVRGLNVAIRNANDGISVAQTAEGAMQEVTTLLQRMREISVQASNDTYSAANRASLQGEMDQLYDEINRIAESTSFNGINLLDGSGGSRSIQVGAEANQTVEMTLSGVKTDDLNLNGMTALGELNSGRLAAATGSTAAGLTINGVDIGSVANVTATTAANAINLETSSTGVSASAYNTYEGGGNVSGVVSDLTIEVGSSGAITIDDSGSMEELAANINRDASGVTATLGADGAITLSNDTGETITIGGTVSNSGLTAGSYVGYVALTDDNNEKIAITETDNLNLANWGFNTSTGSDSVSGSSVQTNAMLAGDLEINGVDVGAVTGSSAGDKAVAINAISDQTGVTAAAETTQEFTVDFSQTGYSATDVSINGSTVDLSAATTLELAITEINTSVKGVTASADETGKLVLTSASGLDIEVQDLSGKELLGLGDTVAHVYTGEISLTSTDGGDIVITGDGEAKAGLVEQGGSTADIGKGLSLETVANANIAIQRIDDALANVASQRGTLGAVQNRLDSTISNLGNVAENLTAANSRILDADFASETAAMTKAQVMSQAGTAMLAQANQLPQMVLSLLQ